MDNPKEFPASHPQNNHGPNNACDHDVPYFNFMGVQDPPLLHECFVCQRRFPSEKALSGHMKQHPGRSWRGLRPPHIPNASGRSIPPPFFYVPGFCPPPIAESSV